MFMYELHYIKLISNYIINVLLKSLSRDVPIESLHTQSHKSQLEQVIEVELIKWKL